MSQTIGALILPTGMLKVLSAVLLLQEACVVSRCASSAGPALGILNPYTRPSLAPGFALVPLLSGDGADTQDEG